MMNKISPKALLHSKWTKVKVVNKERHFLITKVKINEDQQVVSCVIEAVINKNEYHIEWRDLKSREVWLMGWR